jgi:hypothetical protein
VLLPRRVSERTIAGTARRICPESLTGKRKVCQESWTLELNGAQNVNCITFFPARGTRVDCAQTFGTGPRAATRFATSPATRIRGKECFVNVEMALVLGDVALAMSLVEHAPLLGRELERVSEALEHQVAVLRAIAVPSERGE